MVIDSSVMVAIAHDEPETASFIGAIIDAMVRQISAANLFEAAIVVDGRGSIRARDRFDALCSRLAIEISPVTEQHYRLARDAYRRFGKGNHPAGLNFGDCFAYALAMASGEPLLFKGCDFARTDVRLAAVE